MLGMMDYKKKLHNLNKQIKSNIKYIAKIYAY